MNAIVQGYVQDVKYILEPVARDDGPTFAQRFANFMNQMTEHSYNAWERTNKTEIL
mgnify:FL=1|jgi:hypothetical protein